MAALTAAHSTPKKLTDPLTTIAELTTTNHTNHGDSQPTTAPPRAPMTPPAKPVEADGQVLSPSLLNLPIRGAPSDDDDDDLNDDDMHQEEKSDDDDDDDDAYMQAGDPSDSDDSSQPDITVLQRDSQQPIPDGILPRPTRRHSGPSQPSKKMGTKEHPKPTPVKVSTNRKSKQQPTTSKAAANSGRKPR
jgi:hypothetical protein